jgi:hypothetical protein
MQIKTALFIAIAIAIGCASAENSTENSPPSPWSGQWSGTEFDFDVPTRQNAVQVTFNGDGTASYAGARTWNASKIFDDNTFVGWSDDPVSACPGAVHCAFRSTIIQMVCTFTCDNGGAYGGTFWVALDRK